jgi:ribosomal protein S18 acetylase RimI-like enzyme
MTAPAIAPYREEDEEDLFAAFAAVVEEGGGYPQGPPTTREGFRAVWFGPAVAAVRVARFDDEFAGAYYLKPNFPGRAAHIANAGYLDVAAMRGRGVGEALVVDSLDVAREHGFDAMMFNLVFESNPAARLYERLGFEQIGRIPDAVDGEAARIYWRSLAD